MVYVDDYFEMDVVGDLPLRSALVVNEMTLIRAAIAMMRSHSLGCAIVADSELKPIGLFTERSVVNVLMQNAAGLDSRPVGEFLDPKFLTVTCTEPVARVWDAISKDGLRFVCVTDDEGRVMGLTGQRGIAEYVSDFFPQRLIVQRLGSKPWMEHREGA